MKKQRNPDIFGMLQVLIIGGVAVFVIGKISKPGGGGPGGLFPPTPDDRRRAGLPAFKLGQNDWDRWIRTDGIMHVTWRMQHWGPAGRYWAGAHIGCLGGGENQEQYFDVGDDAEWADYTVQATLRFTTITAAPQTPCGLKLYVADANNNWLVDQMEWVGVIIV